MYDISISKFNPRIPNQGKLLGESNFLLGKICKDFIFILPFVELVRGLPTHPNQKPEDSQIYAINSF